MSVQTQQIDFQMRLLGLTNARGADLGTEPETGAEKYAVAKTDIRLEHFQYCWLCSIKFGKMCPQSSSFMVLGSALVKGHKFPPEY